MDEQEDYRRLASFCAYLIGGGFAAIIAAFGATLIFPLVTPLTEAILGERPWSQVFASLRPFEKQFWSEMTPGAPAICGSFIFGPVFGALTAFVPRRLRHPLSTTILWACVPVTFWMVVLATAPSAQIGIMRKFVALGMMACIGAIYGALLGFCGGCLERWLVHVSNPTDTRCNKDVT